MSNGDTTPDGGRESGLFTAWRLFHRVHASTHDPYAVSTGRRFATENTVANPDNVVVLQDARVVIGEDTSIHDNDMVWVCKPQ